MRRQDGGPGAFAGPQEPSPGSDARRRGTGPEAVARPREPGPGSDARRREAGPGLRAGPRPKARPGRVVWLWPAGPGLAV